MSEGSVLRHLVKIEFLLQFYFLFYSTVPFLLLQPVIRDFSKLFRFRIWFHLSSCFSTLYLLTYAILSFTCAYVFEHVVWV